MIKTIICGDNLEIMPLIADQSIDLIVTSPPYDNLRDYHGYSIDISAMIVEFMRIMKQGGVIVWVVGDQTIDGSETGSSFRQALAFMDNGYKLHDTMIWNKGGFSAVGALKTRYASVFEYMFVFVKGKLDTFNPIKDRWTRNGGKQVNGTIRCKNGTTKPMSKKVIISEFSQRFNIWDIFPKRQSGICHPAPFPDKLAVDHILSWSNPGDIILDPMCGSGTVCKMAEATDRLWIGIDISEEYCEIARGNIQPEYDQLKLDLYREGSC